MFPILKNCLVRGCKGDYFLQNYLTGQEFVLDDLQANILWNCNGGNTEDDLAVKFCQPKESVRGFLDYLEGCDLVRRTDRSDQVVYPNLMEPPLLQDVQFEGTGQCNLWCKHCYGRQYFAESAKEELSTAEMMAVIDQVAEANIGKCFLSGGEIFTRKDLPEIIGYLAKRHIYINGIFTNGTIFRQDVIDALRSSGLTATFLVSLDGHTADIHDFARGDGNFERTISFIEKMTNADFRVTVNTVAMKQNVHSLVDMKGYLSDLGVSRWRISVPREQGEMIENRNVIEPAWEDVFSAYRAILLDTLANPGKMRIQLSSIFKTEFLSKGYYLYNRDSSCCEYKKRSLVITANGNVIACPAGYKEVLGNVRTENILDIWRSEKVQALKNLPISKTECINCDIWEYCGGGCRVIAEQLHGSRLAKDDNSCQLYHFFYDVVRPILESHGVEVKKLRQEA